MNPGLENISLLLKEPDGSQAYTIDSLCEGLCMEFCKESGIQSWHDLLKHTALQEFGVRYCKSVDSRFAYVCASLVSLLQLRAQLVEVSRQNDTLKSCVGPQDYIPPDLLSVKQQNDVLKLAQHTIALGVLPNLLQGVGIPLKRRSEYAKELLDQASVSGVSDVEKYDRLSFTTRAILRVASHPTLGGLLFSKHLIDILAALLQLCFAPIKEPDPNSKSTLVTPALYARFMSERREFKSQLDHVLDVAYQPTAIRSLLLLQGAPGNLDTVPRSGPLVIAPVWLRNACAQKLTASLMRYNGVIHVAEATLSDVVEGSLELNRLNAIARLISTPPKDVPMEKYYQAVSPQVITILRTSDPKSQHVYLQLAFRIIQLMMEKSEKLTYEFLLKPVVEPLLKCTECPDYEKYEIPDEYQISKCVEDLHKCFVVNAEPGESVTVYLKSVLHVLFRIHSCISYGVSHLRKAVEELLLRALQNNSANQNVVIFNLLAFDRVESNVFKLKKGLKFAPGDEGGVVATFDENDENWLVSDDERAITVVDLLTKQGDSDTLSQFFLHLLNRLGGMIHVTEEDSDSEDGDFESQLLRIERQLDEKMAKLRESLMVIRLLGLLSESDNIQDVIMKDPVKVVEFTKSTLHRAVMLLQESPGLQPVENESVCLAIAILASVASNSTKTTDIIWDRLQTVIPLLDSLISHYPDENVQDCAEDLKLVVTSQGAYTNEMAKKMRREKRKAERLAEEKAKKKLVEEVVSDEKVNGDAVAKDVKPGHVDFEFGKKSKESEKEGYSEALEHIEDPLIPIKGHGLILLSNLVRSKDEETLRNKEAVLQIFKRHLENDDSYVFLAAVRGLVAMGDLYPDDVISLISREMSSSSRSIDVRVKLGEALVGILRILGELTPKYKDQILNLLLNGARNKEAAIRVSSLSALGETLRNLKHSVAGMSQEITSCLLEIVRSLDDSDVKSAALLCVTYLLQGLGNSALEILKSNMAELHRELRRVLAVEKDDQIRLHANLALDEIDQLMKSLLDPSGRPIQKEIFITRPPQ